MCSWLSIKRTGRQLVTIVDEMKSFQPCVYGRLSWCFIAQSTHKSHVKQVRLSKHTFFGQALSSKCLTNICALLSQETNNCPSWISGRERMTIKIFHDQSPWKNVVRPGRDRTHNLLITSQTCIWLSHKGRLLSVWNILFSLWFWTHSLLHIGVSAINQEQNGKQCRSRWDSSLWAFLSGSWLIVLGFNDTPTFVGHFVSSPREREKRDRRERDREERRTGMKVKK